MAISPRGFNAASEGDPQPHRRRTASVPATARNFSCQRFELFQLTISPGRTGADLASAINPPKLSLLRSILSAPSWFPAGALTRRGALPGAEGLDFRLIAA